MIRKNKRSNEMEINDKELEEYVSEGVAETFIRSYENQIIELMKARYKRYPTKKMIKNG